MKHIFVLFLVTLIFYYSCENPSDPSSSSLPVNLKIQGNIFNYKNEYKQFNYYIGIINQKFDSTYINNVGEFEILLMKPDSTNLKKYVYQDGQSGGIMYRDSVRFSDPNIKYVIYIFSISEDDGLETVIDNAKRKEEFGYPEVGDYYNLYYYSGGESEVTGKFEQEIIATGFKVITNFNCRLKKGWNILTSRLIERDEIKEVYEVTKADSIPNTWVIVGGSSFFNRRL